MDNSSILYNGKDIPLNKQLGNLHNIYKMRQTKYNCGKIKKLNYKKLIKLVKEKSPNKSLSMAISILKKIQT
jgi:hypothetical protein